MSIFFVRLAALLVPLIALQAASHAAVVCGTVNDTAIVYDESDKKPYYSIIPMAYCTVYVMVTCAEKSRDTYFAITDAKGYYSVTITEPDCAETGLYSIQSGDKSQPPRLSTYQSNSCGSPADSCYTFNLHRVHNYSDTSLGLAGYKYSIFFDEMESFVKEGMVLKGKSIIYGLPQARDTLYFPDGAMYRYQMLTSSGRLVYDSTVLKDTAGKTAKLYLDENYFQQHDHQIPVPKQLELYYADFAADRKLSLVIHFLNTGITDTIYFQVSNESIGFETTGAAAGNRKIHNSGSQVTSSSDGQNLELAFEKPGAYSVELYSPNGRRISTIARNVWFDAGAHILSPALHGVNTPGTVIAKVTGVRGTTTSTLKIIR